MSIATAGVIGLLVQLLIALFVIVALRRISIAFALLGGAVAAIYGYGLVQSSLMLFAVPWPVTNILLALLMATGLLRRNIRSFVGEGLIDLAKSVRGNWGAATLLGMVVAFQLFINAIKPEMSIDGQLYHGPVLASLVDTGTLWGWTPLNQYLYYTDLTMVSTVNLATFTGQTWFDDAAQVPHLVILLLGFVWALRSRFSSAFLRVSVATLFIAAPVIWIQARVLYVDVAYGAAVFVAIALIVLTKRWDRSHIVISGIAVAAVMATKPTGILTSALLTIVAWAVITRYNYRKRNDLNQGWVRCTFASIGLFAVPFIGAVTFYVRNYISFSNPVYPIEAKFGPVSFPGIVDLSVFMTGDRGSGIVDPARLYVYLRSLWHGATLGVTKLDYDPRDGGYGYVPLALLLILVIILVLELAVRSRVPKSGRKGQFRFWPEQLGIALLAGAVLLIQPSTFDTRYVVGPTAALVVAGILTTFGAALPVLLQTSISLVALAASVVQIGWTESRVYPGLAVVLQLRTLQTLQQPATTGNPWGASPLTNWLPTGQCVNIAVQSSGGLTKAGMSERSYLATLSYGLYGDRLCNRIAPVILTEYSDATSGAPSSTRNPFANANYAVLYSADVAKWKSILGNASLCWQDYESLAGVGDWPDKLAVLHNTCQ